ncbi:ABC transporter ATP-binding protein [Kitasatospora sp. NPDC002227]|uniref:ABC transporter ATP-binding protein n=1 Tax=Kitasatospora sp. NPDC002227 TaxID=3154773 RepID=UPI0033259836
MAQVHEGDAGAGQPALEISGVSYELGDGRELFRDLALELKAGETVAVTGSSGSGKSTLLSCVLGLQRPRSGSIRVAGAEVAALRGRQLAEFRRSRLGMVFQFGELLPELSPTDNVALAALLAGHGRKRSYRRAAALLGELGVPAAATTDRLSGGERQRTAVARALVNSPALLLADEPTGALDAAARDKVAELLFTMPSRFGCAVLVVTHDLDVAARADRVLELRDGQLTADAGAPIGRVA